MTAINHALTGAVIGLLVGEPLIAVPAAIASHFVCDVIPHFGSNNNDKAIKTSRYRNYLIAEAALCGFLVLMLGLARPEHWLLAAICAFLAAAPDFFWINRFLTIREGKRWRPGWFSRFAGGIQWFQKPIGAVVEVAWFVAAVAVLAPFIY